MNDEHWVQTCIPNKRGDLAHVVRYVDSWLRRGTPQRIEVRYCTQGGDRLDPVKAKSAIASLLVQYGMEQVPLSVRAHAGAIDEATGEHYVRLLFQVQEASPQAAGTWRERLVHFFGLRRRSASEAAVDRGRQAAARLFRQALAREAQAGGGDPVKGRQADVSAATVIVREHGLDALLRPMLTASRAQAARSVAGMLQSFGLKTTDGFQVDYLSTSGGDGTGYAGEYDVEVRLVWTMPARDESTAIPKNEEETALRSSESISAIWLIGTLDEAFAEPVQLSSGQMSLRFDRDVLVASLPTGQARWTRVASNSCPLTVHALGRESWRIEAGSRRHSGRPDQHMYFDYETRRPLEVSQDWQPGRRRIIVNSPNGVVDREGHRLSALVIDLVLS